MREEANGSTCVGSYSGIFRIQAVFSFGCMIVADACLGLRPLLLVFLPAGWHEGKDVPLPLIVTMP